MSIVQQNIVLRILEKLIRLLFQQAEWLYGTLYLTNENYQQDDFLNGQRLDPKTGMVSPIAVLLCARTCHSSVTSRKTLTAINYRSCRSFYLCIRKPR